MNRKQNIRVAVIADNGGGITLQVDYQVGREPREYTYSGDDAHTIARCLKDLHLEDTPQDWEGDNPEARMDWDENVERNGGYRWFGAPGYTTGTPDEVIAAIRDAGDTGWANIQELQTALS